MSRILLTIFVMTWSISAFGSTDYAVLIDGIKHECKEGESFHYVTLKFFASELPLISLDEAKEQLHEEFCLLTVGQVNVEGKCVPSVGAEYVHTALVTTVSLASIKLGEEISIDNTQCSLQPEK